MSLTIQQIITDAKRLAGRLKERDTVADVLLDETHQISKKIDAMKQYQEEVEILNDVASQKPHGELIANIQRENRQVREIQQENRELRAALEEHQTALQHIMSKYRQHTNRKIYETRLDFARLQREQYNEIIQRQVERINEMTSIMNHAANMEGADLNKSDEIMAKLRTENKGLREMLNISSKNGTLGNNLLSPMTEDKMVQTDKTQ